MQAKTKQLELDEDLPFQRAEWRVQRIGWVVWGLIIVAALAGLMGSGPLSSTEASATDGSTSIRYDRFVHYHHESQLELTIHRDLVGGTALNVHVSQALLDRIQIIRIEPQPTSRQLAADGIVYSFSHQDRMESAKIVVHLDFRKFGTTAGQIRVAGHAPVKLRHFVYP